MLWRGWSLRDGDEDLSLPRPLHVRPSPKYRTKEEVSSYRKEHDPIDTLRVYMEQNGMGDEASFKDI